MDNEVLNKIDERLPGPVLKELNGFKEDIERYRTGQIGEVKFQKIRLQLGTYAQRQSGVQMQRIKIPYGRVTSDQMRRLSEVSDKYSTGSMHLTTRQDVQLYYLDLQSVPDMMKELADAGITTREACGNTVRNVTASPFTGASPNDTFDVTPYAEAFKEFMLRNPICQNMGRKFKVCFESDPDVDNAGIMIHDLGFRAVIKEADGRRQKGFQLYVGGGLGASPSLGHLWSSFVPVEEMIPLSTSIIRVFDRYGERKVRMKARMKFLIRKLGLDRFRELVEEERANLEVDASWNDYLRYISDNEVPPDKEYDLEPVSGSIKDDPDFLDWKAANVSPAGTEGYSVVTIKIKLGDVSSDSGRFLADTADRYADGNLRITIQQNLLIRWVPNEAVPSLYTALKSNDLADPGADSFRDITACPGADTCRLGITSAKGLATELAGLMNNGLGKYKQTCKDLKIKISGCPNSCAQHVAASIGFQGASITKDGRSVPAVMLFLGGGLYGDDTRLAMPIGKVPTRNAPEVVNRLLEMYENDKENGEHFDLYVRRLGSKAIKTVLKEYSDIPSYEDDPDFYRDWGYEEEKFELQQGVKGECAGVTVEEKTPTFADSEKRFEQAQAFFIHGEYEDCINELYLACSDSAHVPLYAKLVDPFTPEQTIWEFENILVRTGDADKRWMNVSKTFTDYRTGSYGPEDAVKFLELAKDFNTECRRVHSELTKG